MGNFQKNPNEGPAGNRSREPARHRAIGLTLALASAGSVFLVGALLFYGGWLAALLTFVAIVLAFAVIVSHLADASAPAEAAGARPVQTLFARVLARVRLN